MENNIEINGDSDFENLINIAKEFAFSAHKNQIRKFSKMPYITHIELTTTFLWKTCKKDISNEAYVASILHDTLEDTNVSVEEIKNIFGNKVAGLVLELTNDKTKYKDNKKVYMSEKMNSMSEEALTIKLCDRLSNIVDLGNKSVPIEFVKKYVEDTVYVINNLYTNINKYQAELITKLKAGLLYIKLDRNI